MPGGYPIDFDVCNCTDYGNDLTNVRGTALTCGVDSYGTIVQLVSSTAVDTCWMCVDLWTNGSNNTSNQQSVTIYVGGSGSEQAIVNDLMVVMPFSAYKHVQYSFPLSIPTGTRVSAAAASHFADTVYCAVTLTDGAFSQSEGIAGVDSIGFTVSNAHGVSVTGGTGGTKGSYTQITASSGKDYCGLMLCTGATLSNASVITDRQLWDIAIGSGNTIIIPDIPFSATVNADVNFVRGTPYFVNIPVSTKISARFVESGSSAAVGLILYGLYR